MYEESENWIWDLRCSAAYNSDYYSILHRYFPTLETHSSCIYSQDKQIPCHKPLSLQQCPVVDDRLVLSTWYIYEDFLYYAYDNMTWNQLWYPQKGGFPSHDIGKVEESHVVSVTLDGKNTFEIPADSLNKLIALLSQTSRSLKDDSPEQRTARLQAKKEIRQILGLKPYPQAVSPSLSNETTWRMSYMLSPSLSVNITCQVLESCSFNNSMLVRHLFMIHRNLISLTPVSTTHLVAVSNVLASNETHIMMAERMEDGQAIRYECVLKLQVTNIIQLIPCVLTDPQVNEMSIKIETVLEEGSVCSVSPTELVMGDEDCNVHIPIQQSFAQQNASLIAIDSFRRIKKLWSMSLASREVLYASVLLKPVQSTYPFVEWKSDHLLYQDDVYSIAILHSVVQHHGILIGRESDYDELLMYIEGIEADTGSVL